jgi:hypothetical protein
VFRLGGIKVWSEDRRKVDGGRAAFDEGSGGQVQVGWAFMLGAIEVWSADWQDIFRSGRETNGGSSDFGGRESAANGDARSQNRRKVKKNVHSQRRDQSQGCSSKANVLRLAERQIRVASW